MKQEDLIKLVDELRKLPSETEWVEFKVNNYTPQLIGEYISALSNSACLHNQKNAYIVFGIVNKIHDVKGTSFEPLKEKIGNEELENWLATQLEPRIDFKFNSIFYQDKKVVVVKIDPACNIPIKFKGIAYIRVGSYKKKLDDHPEKARKIWNNISQIDWSAQVCDMATLNDLESIAIEKARKEFIRKNHNLAEEVKKWDDTTFLNKAKITIHGRITNTTIILLGKPESEQFISPAVAKMSWIYKNDKNIEEDYEHFGPPFILNTDIVLTKIRNLRYRYLPNNTLFPIEITKYEPYVIREALHNCIAHQDYSLQSRIIVVERPDELIFTNAGSFIPGTVEAVIEQDAPQKHYRNKFLADAMVNLNMIDTVGGGIKKMFTIQKNRFFPLPSYDLQKTNEVTVHIIGKILDEKYTKLLIKNTELNIMLVILLDKLQKGIKISKEEFKILKSQNLIEGRFPNIFINPEIAAVTGNKATYIKNRAFDKEHYKKMILSFIDKYKEASRKNINDLLMDKISDALTLKQKKIKINNLLNEMANKDKSIKNTGSDIKSRWVKN